MLCTKIKVKCNIDIDSSNTRNKEKIKIIKNKIIDGILLDDGSLKITDEYGIERTCRGGWQNWWTVV